MNAASADIDLVLYDSAGTALGTATITEAQDAVGSAIAVVSAGFEAVSITAGDTYRIVAKATGTGQTRVRFIDFANATHRVAASGPLYTTTKNDSDAFIDDTTRVCTLIPILSAIAAGGGGGGLRLIGKGGLVQ